MPYAANYHTHTFRCKHATGDAGDYVRAAHSNGMHTLGMSDHTPLPDDQWPEVRMPLSQLDEYMAAIASAQREFPQITVLAGLECEFTPAYDGWYREEILGRRGLDYLIGACHWTPMGADGWSEWVGSFESLHSAKHLANYARYAAQTMESGLFAFLAHPDSFAGVHAEWTPDILAMTNDLCAAAAATQTPLELNANGLRRPKMKTSSGPRNRYPWREFWEVAACHGCTVVMNSDAHRPEDVAHGYDELNALRKELGLVEADLSYLHGERRWLAQSEVEV